MPYWTVRTELDDAPGRLAGISGAIAACGGNIVALDVHPIGSNMVADELVVEAAALDPAALAQVVADAGGQRITVTSSDPHDLVDAQTRGLRLLHGLSLATGRRDAALEGALTVLLRADRCCLLPASAAGLSYLAERALADGLPAAGEEPQVQNGAPAPATQVLVVPWRESRGDVRLAVISRAKPAFTQIEGARARGFLLVAAAVAPKEGAGADLLLESGTEVRLRPANPLDAAGIAALHRACPLAAPPVPGIGALGRYLVWVRDSLTSVATDDTCVVVAERAGMVVAVAGYEREPESEIARFGVLVHPSLAAAPIGSALVRRLGAAAERAGLRSLVASGGFGDAGIAAGRASGLERTVKRTFARRTIRLDLQPVARPTEQLPARAAVTTQP